MDACILSRMSVITAFFSLTVDVRYSWSRSSRKRRSSTINSSIAANQGERKGTVRPSGAHTPRDKRVSFQLGWARCSHVGGKFAWSMWIQAAPSRQRHRPFTFALTRRSASGGTSGAVWPTDRAVTQTPDIMVWVTYQMSMLRRGWEFRMPNSFRITTGMRFQKLNTALCLRRAGSTPGKAVSVFVQLRQRRRCQGGLGCGLLTKYVPHRITADSRPGYVAEVRH